MLTDKTLSPFDPTLIRNYYFIRTDAGDIVIQFIAAGDRHRMIKQDNGKICIITQREQGKPYRYGPPLPVEEAIAILMCKSYPTHEHIAHHIREQIKTLL